MADPATAANLNQFEVKHFSLNVAADFDSRLVFGRADLTVAVKPAADTTFILDVHKLNVHHITAVSNWNDDFASGTPLSFEVVDFTGFGSALRIDLSPLSSTVSARRLPSLLLIRVWYSASDGPAICWLQPQQTAGKTLPFLFTQGQACLNRSLFPCQDSPSARATWKATVIVGKAFTAVMSAPMANEVKGDSAVGQDLEDDDAEIRGLYPPSSEATGLPKVTGEKFHAFTANMPDRVPVYLVALAVGDLKTAPVGARSRVWTEPIQLERAAHEFGANDVTEQYVAAGERMFGPYRWGRYDICVMPPSFPYGGMENPTMTFVTPALLAGDQSLTDVVAHEIAHSWTGNLVTNSTWQNFFLNEGFTMYLQRRITTAVHGAEVTALETVTGRALLRAMMRDYGKDHPLTRLTVPLEEGIDPDDTYTEAPYEKGFAFVSYLRACVGSDEAFDAWLTAYTSKYAFQSITPADMFDSFFERFPQFRGDWTRSVWAEEERGSAPSWWTRPCEVPEDLEESGRLPALPDSIVGENGKRGLAWRPGYEFMRWLHAPGWPAYYPSLTAAESLTKPAEALLSEWLVAAAAGKSALDTLSGSHSALAVQSWPTLQKLHFLDTLLQHAEGHNAAVNADLLRALSSAYGFNTSSNAEIRLRWSQIVSLALFEEGFESIEGFLRSTGKLKYVTPVMRALVASPAAVSDGSYPTRDLAKRIYAELKPTLHPAVVSRVSGVLEPLGLA